MLNSYVVIVFALINLIISNLTSLSWRCYVHSLAPLTINILTYLNNVLFQTYNLGHDWLAVCRHLSVGDPHPADGGGDPGRHRRG